MEKLSFHFVIISYYSIQCLPADTVHDNINFVSLKLFLDIYSTLFLCCYLLLPVWVDVPIFGFMSESFMCQWKVLEIV